MIPIAERSTWKLGLFTVRQVVRQDNPYWPAFLIFLGEKLIGRQASRPSESDCEWHRATSGVYATVSVSPQKFTMPRRGRPTNAERERRAALEAQEIPA
jgi:hypothetical protein